MISLVVLHYGNWAVTNECINSIKESAYRDYEIIVEDNDNQKTLYSGGMNRGIKKTKGEIVICMANDTTMSPTCLGHIAKRMEDCSIGAATPMILKHGTYVLENAIPRLGWLGITYSVGYGEQNYGQYDKEKIDYASGACMVLNKKALRHVGLFDEKMEMYWQDVDMSLRMRKLGYKVVLIPQAFVWHKGGTCVSKWNIFKRKYYTTKDRLVGVLKWGIKPPRF